MNSKNPYINQAFSNGDPWGVGQMLSADHSCLAICQLQYKNEGQCCMLFIWPYDINLWTVLTGPLSYGSPKEIIENNWEPLALGAGSPGIRQAFSN